MKKTLIRIAIGLIVFTVILIIVSFINPNKQSQTEPESSPKNQANKQQATSADLSDLEDADLLTIPVPASSNVLQEIPKNFYKIKQELSLVQPQDTSGQNLNLLEHLEKNQVYFPRDILVSLSKIEMYVYQGPDDLAPSQAIYIQNSKASLDNSTIMKDWEKTMIQDLKKFILIGEKYDLVNASGKKNFSYSEVFENTRFVNFSQDKAVSLSYTVGDGFIVISNSYNAQTAMMQKISAI
ncbi:MAG: hypothetical protein ABIC19_02855 [Patescibacteria group bacterium]|nr:hypothetical protein [Patescibacteria group bacterium]